MSWITESWKRIRSVGKHRDALESGLDEEIRFHLDHQTEKNRRAGMNADEARRQAFVRFGGLERARESTRDEIRPALLEDSVRDLRYGFRALWRAPAFTAAALATLALGIGATSAIFSVVRTVMLEPLPYQDPARIVTVWETNRGGAQRNVISLANFVAWRERTRTLDNLGHDRPTVCARGRQRPARHGGGLRLLVGRLSRAWRSARARPRLHGRRRSRREAGHRAEPRVLAAPSRRPLRCARLDAQDRRPATIRNRRHAGGFHRRRSENGVPDSVRRDDGADAGGGGAGECVWDRAAGRGRLARAGVRRDAQPSTPISNGSFRSATPAGR